MSEEFRVLSDEDLHELARPATPGVSRRISFESDDYWFGCAEIAPHLMSGWHHHDRNVTVGMSSRAPSTSSTVGRTRACRCQGGRIFHDAPLGHSP